MSASKTIRHVVIRGRVQGVGYRAWVAHTAHRRKLDGWVRNRMDGSVEAVFAGAADNVAQMIAECRQGPSLARVNGLDDQPGRPDLLMLRSTGEAFAVLPTV